MKQRIAVLTVIAGATVLLSAGGALGGSVGGPLGMMMLVAGIAIVVGCYDAWKDRRGVLGWLGSIVVSLLGSFFGVMASSAVVIPLKTAFGMGRDPGPLLTALVVIFAVLGSWLALAILNRFRSR